MAPYVTFYRLIEQAKMPQRPGRSAAGTLPTRAAQYCDAVTSASAFGWWVYPPVTITVLWDGADIYWYYEGSSTYILLEAFQFPNFSKLFDEFAPAEARGFAPPFLSALPEPGTLQIWTGLIAQSARDWSLLIRGPSNLPKPGGFEPYEGIIETDHWFGPVFVNVRLTRTDRPVHFRHDFPLAQVQPLPRCAYSDEVLEHPGFVDSISSWQPEDWQKYIATNVHPKLNPDQPLGRYAVSARKRRSSERSQGMHQT